MSQQRTTTRRPGMIEVWGWPVTAGVVLAAILLVWGSAQLASGGAVDGNPFAYVLFLALGRATWPGLAATLILITIPVLLAAAAVTVLVIRRRRRQPPTLSRIDEAARRLATDEELHALSPAGVATKAQRLRPSSTVDPTDPTQHGRLIGHTVPSGMPVRCSWEDNAVHIWGPRRGKTTSLVVPNIVEHPGAVIATSNKRDLPDATRGPRERRGQVWVFDPQQVAREAPAFWYNPLSRIESVLEADKLASHIASGSRDPDAKTDSYFDGTAESLLSAYLLAAAHDNRTLVDVYKWLSNPRDKEPRTILDQHGDDLAIVDVDKLVATDAQFIQEAPEKQRGGVFGTALSLMKFVRNPRLREWILPRDDRPQFVPEQFVASADTLYLLSLEGPGSAAPLVSALTDHVIEGARELARTQPGGRVDAPLYAALDEAANTCRWRELPDLLSHVGSQGINIDTILQSWTQGVQAWGENGMKKLWSAANIRTFGGGVFDEPDFLRTLSEMADDYEREYWSTSLDEAGRRSHSASTRESRILSPGLLGAMPPGRELVVASGAPPFIASTVPWFHGPYASQVQDSVNRYDPATTA